VANRLVRLADQRGPGRARHRAGGPGGIRRRRGRPATATTVQRGPATADHGLADGRALAGQAGRPDLPGYRGYQLPGYSLSSGTGLALTAQRIGIARQATCNAATDPAAARVLDRQGCQAVLRATYVDSTGSLVVTVGVAVLPSAAAAGTVAATLPHSGRPGAGVRAVAFSQTLASSFGGRQRQLSWVVSDGPYLIMSVAGYADGRPRVPLSSDSYAAQEMTSAADGVAEAVAMPLGALPTAPRCPGAPGC